MLHGFRSGLEEWVQSSLIDRGQPSGLYEAFSIKYEKPARVSKYTPDFILLNGIIPETKGRFVTADRQKHLLIQRQHPALDIRFVFSRSAQSISTKSKTTYADWCMQKGFNFADKNVPDAWIEEPPYQERIDAVLRIWPDFQRVLDEYGVEPV